MLALVKMDNGIHKIIDAAKYMIILVFAGWKGFFNVRMRSKHKHVFRARVIRLKY